MFISKMCGVRDVKHHSLTADNVCHFLSFIASNSLWGANELALSEGTNECMNKFNMGEFPASKKKVCSQLQVLFGAMGRKTT